MKSVLLLASMVFSLAAFLTLDWFHSAAAERRAIARWNVLNHGVPKDSCWVRDPVRYDAFKPNCTWVMQWGRDAYQLSFNSLGLRDEKVREVPLADARPRILLLGNSFTQGMTSWQDSYVAMMAAQLPQYDFLNGGIMGYSPSNYLNVSRMVLGKGVKIDEAIVFVGVTDVHDEAAVWRDVDYTGAVAKYGPAMNNFIGAVPWSVKKHLSRHFTLTYSLMQRLERFLVLHGYYHLSITHRELPVFDLEATAWTYRKVDDTDQLHGDFAPLGLNRGIAKAQSKMTMLWRELAQRGIPISVVVYPYPGTLVHDSVDSRQVRLWRDWCEGKCKRFVDLFPAFFAVKDQCPGVAAGLLVSEQLRLRRHTLQRLG